MTNTLMRQVAVGESLSFDHGRIVLTLQEKSGRQAALKIRLQENVVVDKPRLPVNEESQIDRGIAFLKS